MNHQIVIDFPDELFSALRSKPEDFVKEMRIAAAVKWYEIGKISQSKAAEIAGISRHDFLGELYKFGVSPFQITPEELKSEYSSES